MGRERLVGATLAVAPCIQPYRRAPGDRKGRPYGTVIELGAFIVRAVEDAGPYGTVIVPGAYPTAAKFSARRFSTGAGYGIMGQNSGRRACSSPPRRKRRNSP